jgi:hypothetical protein
MSTKVHERVTQTVLGVVEGHSRPQKQSSFANGVQGALRAATNSLSMLTQSSQSRAPRIDLSQEILAKCEHPVLMQWAAPVQRHRNARLWLQGDQVGLPDSRPLTGEQR